MHLNALCDFAALVGTYQKGFAIIMEPYDERMPHISDPVLQVSASSTRVAPGKHVGQHPGQRQIH